MNNQSNIIMQNKRLTGILFAVVAILSVPLIAMRFTNEVNWDGADILIMGVLLLVTGLMCEVALRTVINTGARLAVCAGILLTFLLVWVELAVGIFGTPLAGS